MQDELTQRNQLLERVASMHQQRQSAEAAEAADTSVGERVKAWWQSPQLVVILRPAEAIVSCKAPENLWVSKGHRHRRAHQVLVAGTAVRGGHLIGCGRMTCARWQLFRIKGIGMADHAKFWWQDPQLVVSVSPAACCFHLSLG